MDNTISNSKALAIDSKSLDGLKQSAKENSPEALKAAAKQFEAVLMNMMLKSMREASPQDGMMDNEQSKMFTSMLDQQLSSTLSQKGLGLSDVLVRQLSKSLNNGIDATQISKSTELLHSSKNIPAISQNTNKATTNKTSSVLDQAYQKLSQLEQGLSDGVEVQINKLKPMFNDIKQTASKQLSRLENSNVAQTLGNKAQEFVSKMTDAAKAASATSGIPSHFMLGQAALETGWGQSEIKTADGQTSHNLFGIKAGGSWKGKTVDSLTTEYVDGVKHKRIEKFRAYDNYAEAFKDYAKLITDNPRYQQAVANTHDAKAYAHALQHAGYATDPEYGKKLTQVIKKISI